MSSEEFKRRAIERSKEYYNKYKKEVLAKAKIYRAKNKDKNKIYRELNKEKTREYNREYGKRYRESNREKLYEYARAWSRRNPKLRWCSHTMSSHKKSGYIVLFQIEELINKIENLTHCKICGTELNWEANKKVVRNSSPSLDRIENEKELTIDGVQVICYKCNATKRDRSMKELYEYCKMFCNKFKDTYEAE